MIDRHSSVSSDEERNVNNFTTSMSPSSGKIITTIYLAIIRDPALKVIYVIMGTVGILDNMFVVIVFALYIKITDKVIDKQYSIT